MPVEPYTNLSMKTYYETFCDKIRSEFSNLQKLLNETEQIGCCDPWQAHKNYESIDNKLYDIWIEIQNSPLKIDEDRMSYFKTTTTYIKTILLMRFDRMNEIKKQWKM